MRSTSLSPQTGLSLLLLSCWLQTAPAAPRAAVVDLNLTNGLGRLIISEQQASLTVQVPIENRRQSTESSGAPTPPNVAKLGLQVWLLKADGTVIRQQNANPSPSAFP
jgi:hypothetical protein